MRIVVVLYFALFFISCASAQTKLVAVIESNKNHSHLVHARNIVDIIGEKDVKLYLTKLSGNEYSDTLHKVAMGDEKIVNMSLEGCAPMQEEYDAIRLMIKRGKIVVVAGGNRENKKLTCTKVFPASYDIDGMLVAGSPTGFKNNIDIVVDDPTHCHDQGDVTYCLEGSSQAAAKVSRIVLDRYKARNIASGE